MLWDTNKYEVMNSSLRALLFGVPAKYCKTVIRRIYDIDDALDFLTLAECRKYVFWRGIHSVGEAGGLVATCYWSLRRHLPATHIPCSKFLPNENWSYQTRANSSFGCEFTQPPNHLSIGLGPLCEELTTPKDRPKRRHSYSSLPHKEFLRTASIRKRSTTFHFVRLQYDAPRVI